MSISQPCGWGNLAQALMLLGQASGPPGYVLWELGGVGSQEVWEMAQVGMSRHLRVHGYEE